MNTSGNIKKNPDYKPAPSVRQNRDIDAFIEGCAEFWEKFNKLINNKEINNDEN